MTTLLSKTNGQQNATMIWQTMKKGLQTCPSAFECVSEYTFFIAYTLLCMVLKTMILHKGHIRWDKTTLTSAYNVDDKVKQSNGTSIFDTNASFVVCDNSANTHICNNIYICLSPSTQQQQA